MDKTRWIQKRGIIATVLFTFILLCTPQTAQAAEAVIIANSLAFDDVQEAVNEAKDGDTVLLPAGDVIWTKRLSIRYKGITLQGQGADKTIIRCEDVATTMDLKVQEGKPIRITGITFYNIHIYMNGKLHGWRIDHCNFINDKSTKVLEMTQLTTGVMDHCYVQNGCIVAWGGGQGANGNESWKVPLRLGSADSPYIEDCVFDHNVYGCVMDASHGGKYVFRNNTSYNGFLTAHSVQNTKANGTFGRGTRSYEIYNNKIMAVKTDNKFTNYRAVFVRSGTGVIFNNEVDNISGDPFEAAYAMDNLRSYSAQGFLGLADGTSPYDGNDSVFGTTGYPALDQIGRSTDAGEGDTYHPQLLEPLYAWNNRFNGMLQEMVLSNTKSEGVNNVAEHIQENRDYYNIEHPTYEPYSYPHPLTAQTVLQLTSFTIEGITLKPGEMANITWNVPDPDLLNGSITIELYRGEILVSELARVNAASGTFSWTIPETLQAGTNYRIRIYQGAISNDSVDFSITELNNEKIIIVGAGEQYTDIQTAVKAAKPGDTVLIKDGKYAGLVSISVSGTEEAPITVKAAGEGAELFGNIVISGKWIRLEGLHLTAYSDGVLWKTGEGCSGIKVTGSHIEVVNNLVYHAYSYGIECSDYSSYVLVSGNHLLETSAGIYANGDNNIYENNDLEALGNYSPFRSADTDFFRVFGRNVVVRGNYCHGIVNGDHLGGSHVDFVQVYDDNRYDSQNVLIENNIVDSFHHQGFMMEADSYPSEMLIRDWTIRNNIVSGYTSWGVCGGKYGGGIPNLVVENNLFIGSPDGAYNGIVLKGINGYGSVRNNIIYNGGSYSGDMGTTLFDSGNNLIFSDKAETQTPAVNEKNDISGVNPCFADAVSGDYRLRSNSICIDAGMAVNFTYDLAGQTRTHGERTDIGPYEFTGIKDNTAAIRISIDKETLLMNVSDSEQLLATVYPINTTNKGVRWVSSQPSVASVDSAGRIMAVSVGEAVITVSVEGTDVTDSIEVSVRNLPNLRAVSFSPAVVAFDNNTHEYDVEVPYNCESISLTPAFVAGSVSVNGMPQRTGILSEEIPLVLGENVITLIFTDKDGAKSQYVFHLNRVTKLWWKASEGFSTTQGENGWYYQYQRQSDGVIMNLQWSETFQEWLYDTQYNTGVSRTKQAPDASRSGVRAWKAPMDGTITITGAPMKSQSYGKYTLAWIQKNDTVILSPMQVEYQKPVSHEVTVSVKEGDFIYFLVKKELSASSNTIEWDPTITMKIAAKPTERVVFNKKVLPMETETVQSLLASVFPKDGLHQKVVFTTSNASVATVDEAGTVTAVREGTAVITASVKGTVLSDTCTVTVVDHFDRWVASEGFSDTQGKNQWYYYSYMKEDVYTEMEMNASGNSWQSVTKGNKSSISSQVQWPSAYSGPVRAWKAPKDGTITIVGDMIKTSPYYLTNVLTIKKNTQTLFGPYTIADGNRHKHNLSTYVKAGDMIYFIAAIDTRGVTWNPIITYLPIVAPGDVNRDGSVDISDLATIAGNIGKTSEDADWQQVVSCDVNEDGMINIVDLSTVAKLL